MAEHDFSMRVGRAARASAVAVVGICITLALASCGATRVVNGLTKVDLAGSWSVVHANPAAMLELDIDGTLQAKSWPENLWCKDPVAKNTSNVSWNRRLDLPGTWTDGGKDFSYEATLYFPSSSCDSSLTVYGWRGQKGMLELRILLGGAKDFDSATADQIITLKHTVAASN